MEVVASRSQGRTAAAQCGLFTRKSVPFIFEPPCTRSGFFYCLLQSDSQKRRILNWQRALLFKTWEPSKFWELAEDLSGV